MTVESRETMRYLTESSLRTCRKMNKHLSWNPVFPKEYSYEKANKLSNTASLHLKKKFNRRPNKSTKTTPCSHTEVTIKSLHRGRRADRQVFFDLHEKQTDTIHHTNPSVLTTSSSKCSSLTSKNRVCKELRHITSTQTDSRPNLLR
ncbi:hypothetical protein KC19_3G090600 [Ceratodon purpureus]|uniref:Uncharacterized protein n=1 Tax=Ceratodon purpureus TaxID=3225 RepID=A0A8T0IIZ9_CERPU|nr:hypothetical protein KC19_3G090600 [Ceratodon purpureus]